MNRQQTSNRHPLFACAIVVLSIYLSLCGAIARAESLYTINTLASTLVRIDSNTGQTTTVGPVGYEFHNPDLTYLDGNIYAVTAHADGFFANAGYALLTISPKTGQLLNSVELSLNGQKPFLIESLGSANGNLYIGFSPNGTVSTDVGRLNPVTGAITNDINYSAIPGVNNMFGSFGVDLDAMSNDPTHPGTLLTLDTADQTFISIVRIDPVNVTATSVKQFTLNPGLVDDLAVGTFGTYMIGGGNLYTMNLGATSVLQTHALNPAGAFLGLAVPEPSSFLLGLLALIALVASSRRSLLPRTT